MTQLLNIARMEHGKRECATKLGWDHPFLLEMSTLNYAPYRVLQNGSWWHTLRLIVESLIK